MFKTTVQCDVMLYIGTQAGNFACRIIASCCSFLSQDHGSRVAEVLELEDGPLLHLASRYRAVVVSTVCAISMPLLLWYHLTRMSCHVFDSLKPMLMLQCSRLCWLHSW